MSNLPIDLDKHLNALAYSRYFLSESGKWLFYLKEVDGKNLLHRLLISSSEDLSSGEMVCDEDFHLRAFASLFFDEINETLYFKSDVANRENFNCYRISITNRRIEQLTHAKGVAMSNRLFPDKQSLLFIDRIRQEDGGFISSINFLSLKTEELKEIAIDSSKEYRISYSPPIFRKGTDRLLCVVDWKNQRRRMNIAEIDPSTNEFTLLLPAEIENSTLHVPFDESEDDGFFFGSSHEGFEEAYYFSFSDSKIQRLSTIGGRNSGFMFLSDGTYRGLVAALPAPRERATEVQIYGFTRERSGAWLPKMQSTKHDGNLLLLRHKKKIFSYSSSTDALPNLQELDRKSGRALRTIIATLGSKTDLIHSETRFVTYPSFDGLEIPAYLSLPKGQVKAAVIEAFYGGYDQYSPSSQILLESGIAYLSPAVRGSWGWGAEWEKKLQGDLGGGEILDLVWGAKYLEAELGLEPRQIGVEGGSHGGYAALRALTLPDGFKGVASKYPFGFGIAWAGFADLVDFYETSWISDWLVNLLGPIEENRDLYMDRSPINHFNELNAPVFIAHGSNDARVSPSSMDGFLKKLAESDKPHKIYFMKDQGHTAGTIEQRRRMYLSQLEFLKTYVL